jgi:hypothetical protein
MNTPKPIQQRRWKEGELRKAVSLFMSGMEYEEIAEHVKPFDSEAVKHKLGLHGFTKEHRKAAPRKTLLTQ